MTYEDLINQLSQELLPDHRAWPEDDSRVNEQLRALWAAALVQGMYAPSADLKITESDSLPTSGVANGALAALLPDDVFKGRADLGISYVLCDDERIYPEWFVPVSGLRPANAFGKHRKEVALSVRDRRLYVSGAKTVKAGYSPQFPLPTTKTSGFPLPEPYITPVKLMVAAFIEGSKLRNTRQASHLQQMAAVYQAGPTQPEAEES